MGLPVFREPEVDTKATVKVDPTAPSRSAIRRQRTIRRPPVRDGSLITHSPRLSRRPPAYRSLFDATDGHRPSAQHAFDEGIRHHREISELSRHNYLDHGPGANSRHESPLYRRQAGIVDGPLDSEMVEVALGLNRPSSDESRRREDGERLLRDALHSDRPGRRLRAPRESALRYALPSPPPPFVQSFSQLRSGNIGEVTYFMPSPPYSGGDRTNRASPTDGAQDATTTAPNSFSSRFAPAYPHRDQQDSLDEDLPALVDSSTPPEDTSISPHPPLRRVGNLHSASFDGLGDRRRSISSNSSGEEDTWETLLTTIAPDDNLPSTESSFTSASASAATTRSESNSARSSHTLLTAPSAGSRPTLESEYPDLFPPACDLSDSEESDVEGDSTYRRASGPSSGSNSSLPRIIPRRARWVPGRHGRPGRWILPDSEAAAHLQQGDVDRPYRVPSPRVPRRLRSPSIAEQRRQVSQLQSVPADELAVGSPDSEGELEQMHSLLERLARREDIPDEWWAAVGLSRTLVGRHQTPRIADHAGGDLE